MGALSLGKPSSRSFCPGRKRKHPRRLGRVRRDGRGAEEPVGGQENQAKPTLPVGLGVFQAP